MGMNPGCARHIPLTYVIGHCQEKKTLSMVGKRKGELARIRRVLEVEILPSFKKIDEVIQKQAEA
ncbi:BQ5605_C001g00230 [Microbotryum silenes-dioicae]|uniref:BQ5605_C001g00230 protein n=1 Tax=Microbotryum silenes-dioicae TaxID=796604 RepID=A0A2X0M2T4_9BASI|nr:BQ5605_C001g00230 [Microbotryum silenes-dioicae]